MEISPVPQAMEHVYQAFASERKPGRIPACPCCSPADRMGTCALLATDLHQLTPEQLSTYASKVLLTAGSPQDFRYFLPRIMEISINDSSWWPSREVVMGKLALANWSTWPQSLRTPLQQLFEVAFAQALKGDDPIDEIDAWLCGLSQAGEDLTAYLQRLEAPDAESVAVKLYELNAAALAKGKLANAHWANDEVRAAQLNTWFTSPSIQAAVQRYYIGSTSAPCPSMQVIAHRPSSWFLLQEGDELYLDVNCSYSAFGFSMLLRLTQAEVASYGKSGASFLDVFAGQVQEAFSTYRSRNLSGEWQTKVDQAVAKFKKNPA